MKLATTIAAAAVALVASAGMSFAQDVAKGEALFKKHCRACHAIGEGAKNLVGPLQNGLDGRKSGTVPGFNYSDANKNSGITWNEATFLEYIKDPKAKMPGTKMVYAGLKDPQEAKDLWAFIAAHGEDGKKK